MWKLIDTGSSESIYTHTHKHIPYADKKKDEAPGTMACNWPPVFANVDNAVIERCLTRFYFFCLFYVFEGIANPVHSF